MSWRTIGLASSLLLAACHTAPTVAPPVVETRTKVIDTACNWTKPIYLDKSDVLSDATARAVLAHNQAGAKECGWKPLNASATTTH
ncbi:hypothetical protein [Burkholderia gladioli]|uniref:hypothetical protein n=1 Tax=Burkholderia gladioli TaxID=28095 RepID=UPI001FC80C89|nr:hypothetical protein [Burkholderia gladioli]